MDRPAYLALAADGRLQARADAAIARLAACTLCARRCGADRFAGVGTASCQIGRLAKIHAWDEDGIHFAGGPLRCLHCPTPEAGWAAAGEEATPERLAALMLELQRRGCRTIALVQPSHVAAQILEALVLAVAGGLRSRLAWTSGGYDGLATLALLDGIVDLYRPDVKYGDAAVARQCSGIPDYVEINRAIIAEMHRQVGPPQRDDDGVMIRGVVARHQVLPNDMAGTAAALAGLPPGIAVAMAEDYRPAFRADRHAKLNRPPSAEELAVARAVARRLGF